MERAYKRREKKKRVHKCVHAWKHFRVTNSRDNLAFVIGNSTSFMHGISSPISWKFTHLPEHTHTHMPTRFADFPIVMGSAIPWAYRIPFHWGGGGFAKRLGRRWQQLTSYNVYQWPFRGGTWLKCWGSLWSAMMTGISTHDWHRFVFLFCMFCSSWLYNSCIEKKMCVWGGGGS